MGGVLQAPKRRWETLRVKLGPCKVVLSAFWNGFDQIARSAATTIRFTQFEFFDHSASSERLACSVGGSPTGGKVRNPVAWVAFVEETKRMKPTDKAILGMVSESSII